MSKKKRNKGKRNEPKVLEKPVASSVRPKQSFGQSVAAEWSARKAILQPLSIFIAVMSFFYILWVLPFVQENFVSRIASANAYLSSTILNIFGLNVSSVGERMVSDQFSVNVKSGCDGLEAIMICVAGMLVYPAKMPLKLKGIILGVSFLLFLNLVRIITLFLTGIYFNKAFEFMHLDFWQILFIIIAVLTVLFWIQWVNKKGISDIKK